MTVFGRILGQLFANLAVDFISTTRRRRKKEWRGFTLLANQIHLKNLGVSKSGSLEILESPNLGISKSYSLQILQSPYLRVSISWDLQILESGNLGKFSKFWKVLQILESPNMGVWKIWNHQILQSRYLRVSIAWSLNILESQILESPNREVWESWKTLQILESSLNLEISKSWESQILESPNFGKFSKSWKGLQKHSGINERDQRCPEGRFKESHYGSHAVQIESPPFNVHYRALITWLCHHLDLFWSLPCYGL